jgi:uncharacterized membrane protein
MRQPNEIASKLRGMPYEVVDARAKNVARHIADRTHIARNLAKELYAESALVQRAADVVASFGGSWTIVAMFVAVMVAWSF